MKNYKKGFTLIELLIYIVLISLFITGAILFAWDVIYGREKAYQQQVVEQNCRLAMARTAYEIRRAKNIQSIVSSQIVLDDSGSTTTITSASGRVKITTGGAGPYNLTSNQVQVTSLAFTDLTTADNNSKNIQVSLVCEQASQILSGQTKAQATVKQAVELNSQFNQARSLLADASHATLTTGNKRIENTTLENSGSADIIIDKMTVSWTGGTSGSTLKDIQINGSTVWSGTANSGDVLDITNVTLTSGAAAIPIDRFNFSHSMTNSVITVSYTMMDGSTTKTEIVF